MRNSTSAELIWLFKQAKPMLTRHALGVFCVGIGSVLALLDPLIIRWIIDKVIPSEDGHLLFMATLAFAATYIARLAMLYGGSFVIFVAVQKMVFRIRVTLIRGLHRHFCERDREIPLGDMSYRIEQDVGRVGDLSGEILPNVIRMVLVGLTVLTAMCVLNFRLACLVLPLLPIFYSLQRTYRQQLMNAADHSQEQMGSMSTILQEHLAGALQLQLLNCHGAHALKYARHLALGAKAQTVQRMAEVQFSAAYVSIALFGSAMILEYGGREVMHGRLTIGGLVAFYSYITRLLEPLGIAADLQSRTQRVRASIKRIIELEGREAEQRRKPTQRLNKDHPVVLEFCSVSYFHRTGRLILQDLNLQVEVGEKIALVGVSGCGKSTLAHLAVGFFTPYTGSIFLNGRNNQLLGMRNLRSIISLVPQDPVLFYGTLRENLLYGDPHVSRCELERVLSLTQLESFVGSLPRGLDEPLGPMGRRLSGGEKRRVAVARALLMHPKILILDEATSGLDPITSRGFVKALDEFEQEMTLIFISHDTNTISATRRILVLSRGRIVDDGNQSELLLRCPEYRGLHCGNIDRVIPIN
jgi:ABC-type multidrug transport system fused ATPase/permease subunit